MKRNLLIVLAATLLLTGCSASNQSLAEAQVILGCESLNRDFESKGVTPDQASKYFAEAARLDAGFIPLAQAAQVLTKDPWAQYIDVNYQEIRFNAANLLFGVCAK
jgi:hypothetical protein